MLPVDGIDVAGSVLKTWLRTLGHPVHSPSLSLFTALHAITASHDQQYPCVGLPADVAPGTLDRVRFDDHLHVLGHYRDDTPERQIELRHHDRLTSGSQFNDASFESLMDAIANGMLDSTQS